MAFQFRSVIIAAFLCVKVFAYYYDPASELNNYLNLYGIKSSIKNSVKEQVFNYVKDNLPSYAKDDPVILSSYENDVKAYVEDKFNSKFNSAFNEYVSANGVPDYYSSGYIDDLASSITETVSSDFEEKLAPLFSGGGIDELVDIFSSMSFGSLCCCRSDILNKAKEVTKKIINNYLYPEITTLNSSYPYLDGINEITEENISKTLKTVKYLYFNENIKSYLLKREKEKFFYRKNLLIENENFIKRLTEKEKKDLYEKLTRAVEVINGN